MKKSIMHKGLLVFMGMLGAVSVYACPVCTRLLVESNPFCYQSEATFNFIADWTNDEPWDPDHTWKYQIWKDAQGTGQPDWDPAVTPYHFKKGNTSEVNKYTPGPKQAEGGMKLSTNTDGISGPGVYYIRVRAKGEWRNDKGHLRHGWGEWSKPPLKFTIIKVDSIDVWDANSRHAAGGLLEVVPPQAGETITCKATMAPDVVPPTGCPEWTISGHWSSTLYGQQVDFAAANYVSSALWLFKLVPHTYTIEVGDKMCTVKAYTNHKGEKTVQAADWKALNKAIDSWEKIKKGLKNPLFDFSPKPPTGSFSFSNQWEEKNNSHLTQYVWSLSADSTASVSAKAKLSTALAGIPPFLVEAHAFVEFSGSLGVDGSVSLASSGQFKTEGGATGKVTLGLGGEASAVAGLVSIGIKGASSIKATGKLTGKTKPPEVGMDLKITAGDLTVSYEVTALWGAWKDTDSWEVFKGWELYNKHIPFVPGPF